MADSSSYFLISCSSSFFFISLFLLSSYLFFFISILFHIFFSSFLHIFVSSLLPNLFYIHWCVCAYSFYLYDLLASDWFGVHFVSYRTLHWQLSFLVTFIFIFSSVFITFAFLIFTLVSSVFFLYWFLKYAAKWKQG